MLTQVPHFLVIDDDPLNNKLCELVITSRKVNNGPISFSSFTDPESALKNIKENFAKPDANLTVLLLDINMPVINGWQFLEYFDEFDEQVKSCFKIYMLSSSVDHRDIERANSNADVIDFISKPLGVDKVQELIKLYY